MLKVNSINFRYPGVRNLLLKKIKFKVERGEQLYLCGKSGQGKSTLLKIIAGLLQPSSGTVRIDNEKVFGPNFSLIPGHEEIRLVHQEFKLMPNHTVYENIIHHLDYLTTREKKRRADQLSEVLGIDSLYKKLPKALSGGEKQRVAIAQALANPPKLLLLDEPFAHLDFQTQEVTQDLVNTLLRDENITSITVTHHPMDALKHADRILFFENGNLLELGSPIQAYYQPKSLISASYFGNLNRVDKTKFLRPEDLYENPSGKTFTISKKSFLGPYWEYEIKSKAHNWKWLSSKKLIENNVQLNYKKESLISIT
jgi:ABC-type sugar transport system ATPase subunit